MKKRACLIFGFVIGVAPISSAALWHFGVSSLWTKDPVQVDGRATEWSELPVLEEAGLSFRAMNDASNLYLLIRGTSNDGRIILAGEYRQNVTLWFLKPNGKSKAWGIDLDFGHSHPPEETELSPTFASYGIAPQMVMPEGLEVSTAAFPSDFAIAADLSSQIGRQPVYEIRIPLQMIQHSGRSIYIDFVSSDVSAEVREAILTGGRSEQPPSGGKGDAQANSQSGGQSGSHKHGQGGGQAGGGGAPSTLQIRGGFTLHMKVHLAKG